ncbi:hypothetical protein P171DRAFT_518870 [Karstenula rhodostoma CBS 690.94]|uniref:Uncharacterized protein n=1 Tax=Karstenula rhodostoma CBS 690.94 TaxID=1392251 RepID=A0A9P4PPG2_9PLEO|nr:hypothetical protein P171DRAFT_518870 [Karstenula rhodostoma CBS 690.94]
MSSQQDDLLASKSQYHGTTSQHSTHVASENPERRTDLQSSLRNTLATFGPTSPQYISIKYVVDEHMAKAALQSLSLGPRKGDEMEGRDGSGQAMNLAFRPRGT